ncbi:MAG TPA: hypothetical protein VII41_06965, partial [Steroidobacteraceae bacterium]
MIGSSPPPAAARVDRRRRLLGSTSALRIPIASAALALGVALSGEAYAQTTVNPNRMTTYTINPASNPITFGPTTIIDTSGTVGADAVLGNAGTNWNVTVQGGGLITANRNGVYLTSQSTVTNAGRISGSRGIFIKGGTGSVTNAGTISGTITGVALAAGGSVTNQAGGRISGNYGIGIYGASGSVTNGGTINGNVGLFSGGSVRNQAGATIYGIVVTGGSGSATVTNAGTITGTRGMAVSFGGTGSNTLILQTGSVLNGEAVGSNFPGTKTNALVLQGIGSANNNFRTFNTLDVLASGLWALNGISTIGATTVDSGTLVVGDASHPGAALTSPVTVNAGGALAGQGTVIGDVAVLSGGAIAPGAASPFTTLNVTGNASFASGSFYQVNVNGSTAQSDKLVLSGTATLTGGSVQPIYSGPPIKGSSFNILHAGEGL